MSKLSDFLQKQGIDPRRILIASRQIERLQPEDKAIKLARRRAKGEKPSDADKAAAEKKPRSGRPVTRPTLDRALAGGDLSRGARARIARAVNRVLTQKKKKKQVTAADLF